MNFKGVDLIFILANCFLPSSKYFLTALGHVGLNNLLAAYEDKSAVAVCTFAFCAGPGEKPILFQGRTEGKIVPARGPPDFGWDPVFEVDGRTYAEMEKSEKVSFEGNWSGGRLMYVLAEFDQPSI